MRLLALFAILILVFGCVQLPGQKGGGGGTAPTGAPGGTMPAFNGTSDPATPPENDTQPPPEPQQPPVQNQTQPAQNPPIEPQQPPAPSIESREVSYKSSGWTIYGTLYESKNGNPTKAIILVHSLGKDRSEWPARLIERLHDSVPDALILAIDMKGHGKSTGLGTWEGFDVATFKDMKTDILAAKKYLAPEYPQATTYYLVGSSMGSTAAILAAQQDSSIIRLVMVSPGMEYRDVDISAAITDYRHEILAVAASGDAYSAEAVNEIKSIGDRNRITTKLYSGSAHGGELFESTKGDAEPLSDLIVGFLD